MFKKYAAKNHYNVNETAGGSQVPISQIGVKPYIFYAIM
jgi:hypothetical protein